MRHILFVTVFCFAAALAHAADSTAPKQVLTLEGAKQLITAAANEGRRLNAPSGAVAVVDDGGHLLAAERWDNTFAASAVISLGKARTAALFRKPTKLFEDIVNKGRTAMTALPDSLFTPLQGGVPLELDGRVVGAIGVSGAASAQQDEDIASAAIAAWKAAQ